MLDFTVYSSTHFSHIAPASKPQTAKQPATLSYDGGRAILFNQKLRSAACWFRNHAAFVYLMGDGSGPLAGYRAYQPESAPKLYTLASARENLGLGDGLFIVGTHKRLVPAEMTVISHCVGAILRHHRGACRPEDVSHLSMCAAVSACRAWRMSFSRSTPGGVPLASLRRRFACSSRR
jgi:hypothetical protein